MQIPTKPRKKVRGSNREPWPPPANKLNRHKYCGCFQQCLQSKVSAKVHYDFSIFIELTLKGTSYVHVVHVTGQIHCYKELVPSKDSLKYALEKEKVY